MTTVYKTSANEFQTHHKCLRELLHFEGVTRRLTRKHIHTELVTVKLNEDQVSRTKIRNVELWLCQKVSLPANCYIVLEKLKCILSTIWIGSKVGGSKTVHVLKACPSQSNTWGDTKFFDIHMLRI